MQSKIEVVNKRTDEQEDQRYWSHARWDAAACQHWSCQCYAVGTERSSTAFNTALADLVGTKVLPRAVVCLAVSSTIPRKAAGRRAGRQCCCALTWARLLEAMQCMGGGGGTPSSMPQLLYRPLSQGGSRLVEVGGGRQLFT